MRILDFADGFESASEPTLIDTPASDIKVTPNGNLSSTDVQAALVELQDDVDNNTTAISNHLSDSEDAHDASAISNSPSGNLAATDVQSALNELQSDIDTRATSSELSSHESDTTSIHGIADTSELATKSGEETLSSKTLASPVVTTQLDLSNEASLRLFEATGNGTHKVTVKAPSALTDDYTLTLPDDDGSSGQVLTTNGSGKLGWDTVLVASAGRMNSTSAQTIANTTNTTVQFDTVHYESETIFNLSTERFVAARDGLYIWGGTLNYSANGAGYRRVTIVENGAADRLVALVPSAASDNTGISFSGATYLTAGQYLELRTYQTSGGDLSLIRADFYVARVA